MQEVRSPDEALLRYKMEQLKKLDDPQSEQFEKYIEELKETLRAEIAVILERMRKSHGRSNR